MKTLTQWKIDNPDYHVYGAYTGVHVCDCHGAARAQLYRLSDYKVSSAYSNTVWLVPTSKLRPF